MRRKGSLLALRDTTPQLKTTAPEPQAISVSPAGNASVIAPSRHGKKAMTGYFTPEMSFAMHVTARKNGMSLQDAMGSAFNDWLRKMGESPVGK